MSESSEQFDQEFDPKKYTIVDFDITKGYDPDFSAPERDGIHTYEVKDPDYKNIPGAVEISRSELDGSIENIVMYPTMDRKTLLILERTLNQLTPNDRAQFCEDFKYGLPRIEIDLVEEVAVFSMETVPLVVWEPQTGAQIQEELIERVEGVTNSANNFYSNRPDQEVFDGSENFFFQIATFDPHNQVRDEDGRIKSVSMVGTVRFKTADYHKLELAIKYLDSNGTLTEKELRELINPVYTIEMEEDVDGGEERLNIPIITPDNSAFFEDEYIPEPLDIFRNN